MRCALLLSVALLGCSEPAAPVPESAALPMETNAPPPIDLAEFRWDSRLLLVFADRDDSRLAEQNRRFAECVPDLLERDLQVIRVFPDGGAVQMPGANVSAFDGASAEVIRQRFDVAADDFLVVLVGLDGGAKDRYAEPVELDDVFAAIDAMPMRQQELRRRDR
ncbi:MAG: DUF4174 domain-containing protein [Planctomycetota bacterium]